MNIDTINIKKFYNILYNKQTYINSLYLLITCFIGSLYIFVIFMGIFSSLLLSIILVGIPILILTMIFIYFFAEFERLITNSLLNTNINSSNYSINPFEENIISIITNLIGSSQLPRGQAPRLVSGLPL